MTRQKQSWALINMLLVKTHIAASPIQGIGLFADELIPKGTKIWSFEPSFDVQISREKSELLPEISRNFLHHYGHLDDNVFVFGSDDARFMNHSEDSNTTGVESPDSFGETIAARDIHPGEEITCDYYEFDEGVKSKLGLVE